MKAGRHFSLFMGCRMSAADAAKLAALALRSGLPKSGVVRALVQRATVEALEIPAAPAPEEALVTPT